MTTRLNPFAVLTRRRCLAWFTIGPLLLAANYVAATEDATIEDTNSLDVLRQHVELGEFELAIDELSTQINEIREVHGNFAVRLSEPYIVLGDAQVGIGEVEDAVESFISALNVTRMNKGLNSTDQLPSLYRIAGALTTLGDYQNANVAQERAYAIMLNQLGAKNPQLLPSMLTLIDWYESNRRFSAAKILYIEAIQIAHRALPPDDIRQVELSRAFAAGMRNTVFPPMDSASRYRPFDVAVPGYEPPGPGKAPPSSYSLGARALVSVVNFVEEHAPSDRETIATAKLNLADWHQLFGRESKATRMYREIWKGLESLPTVRDSMFGEPKLLYIRLPEFNAPSDTSEYGVVELLLTVSYRGAVTGRISQIVDPPNTDIEFRTRVAAREARFRPAMKDGKPLTTRDFLLKHHYPLPKRNL